MTTKPTKADRALAKIKPMTPGVPQSARTRAYAAGCVVLLGLVGVGYKAWALQVDEGDKYRELAMRQHAMRVEIPGPRGEVVDAHGRPLAVSADADSIWANPREVHDVATTAEKLAALVPNSDARVLESRLAGDRGFVWLVRHVTPEIAKKVRDAKIPGIEVASEPRRWYPGKSIAGPVIGRADIDGNGVDGIELSMNDVLQGKRGAVTALRDAHGRRMLSAGTAPNESGAVVQLSLDRSIQAITDEALATSVTENKAKNGVAVVLDVKTGRVLAMSSYPTYDPNTGADHGARNRPVTDSYEAGSVMKVFTVASALEDGDVTPTTGFSTMPYKVGPKMMRDTHAHPYLTTSQIIQVSSNVGASKIALRLGRDRMYSYFKLFGFGAKSGIELPGETTGKLRPGSTWRDVELATMSYGYGLTVTPLQLAAGFAAIGNDGVYTEPRIVDEVRDADGNVTYRGEGKQHRVLTVEHAKQMRAILATVFEKGQGEHAINGTAASVVVPGFKCGGKTGTAYKYDHAIRSYSTNRYLGSFAGLAPIDNPRLAIIVMIDEPGGDKHYGGDVAAPAFAKIASESLRYLGVPGDPLPPPKPVPGAAPAAPKPSPVAAPAAEDADDSASADAAPDGDGADEDASGIMIPDFRGMGVGRALDEARKVHLDVDVEGTGQVIAQDPAPGRVATPTRVKLTFSVGSRKISAP